MSKYIQYKHVWKLFEMDCLHQQVYIFTLSKFLYKFDCLYKKQFGFRDAHSTSHALISIPEEIRKALDNNEFSCGIFLYFQKAFDTVNHKILIDKLHHYGVRGVTLSWF